MSDRIYLLVELAVEHRGALGDAEAAEVLENIIERAICEGEFEYLHGGGPNPPYHGNPQLVSVSTEVL